MNRKARLGTTLALGLSLLASGAVATVPSATASAATAVSGGTATFAEPPGTTPNYIFPMLTGAYYSVANIEQFERLSFRSLYWIGNAKGQPVVDPAMSLAALPVYSDNDTVVTINLGDYKWSNGTPVTSRDVEFWINLLEANKKSFAAYVPGEFPDNLKSFKVNGAKQIVLTLSAPVNPTWFTYDQLSQITPLPLAWDKASATDTTANEDETPAGAVKVFDYLTAQSKDIATYGSNPLWKVVDGPWKLVGYQSDGYAKFAANPAYSGPTKPKLAFFVEQPFTTDTSELDVLHSGTTIDYGYVPEQDASQSSELESQGYTSADWNGWGTTFFVMNYNNPKTGPIIKQTYIRQAMQSLIDQPAYVSGPLKGFGHTNYGPVPSQPTNPYSDSYEGKGPWPYAPKTATNLLSSHGWKVKPNGVTTCSAPGTGARQCGAGIAAGAQLSFSLDYATGNVEVSQEMQALKSSFSQAGIDINLSTAPFDTVIADSAPCTAAQSSCSWEMSNWGGGWTYGVDPYPTGDQIFATGSGSNFENYNDAKANQLIQATLHSNTGLDTYENYLADQVPVLWLPQPTYQISEISKTLQGTQPQSPIEGLTPENWYFTK
jgi:peptide/nickel transport system substrate-binding protein